MPEYWDAYLEDGTKTEIILDHTVIRLHLQMEGAQRGQILDALQHIGRVAQGILDALGGGIAGLGKGTEGCHISKVPPVKDTNIVFPRPSGSNNLCSLYRICGKSQTAGKIIG